MQRCEPILFEEKGRLREIRSLLAIYHLRDVHLPRYLWTLLVRYE